MTKRPREEDDEKISSAELVSIVQDIQSHPGNEHTRQQVFEKKYSKFAVAYPFLFKMACEETFDYDRFKYMLELRDKIDASKVSFEDASKEVGQRMFDTYVKHNVSHVKPNQ